MFLKKAAYSFHQQPLPRAHQELPVKTQRPSCSAPNRLTVYPAVVSRSLQPIYAALRRNVCIDASQRACCTKSIVVI
jgi:hypothetical protein